MRRVTLEAHVGGDGILHLPLGLDQANRNVRVTIEPARPVAHDDDYLEFLRTTAGAWQGDFERPDQGDYEVRDPME